jgi:hypothetical protein
MQQFQPESSARQCLAVSGARRRRDGGDVFGNRDGIDGHQLLVDLWLLVYAGSGKLPKPPTPNNILFGTMLVFTRVVAFPFDTSEQEQRPSPWK